MSPESQRITIAEACGYKDIARRVICEGTGMDTWVLSSGVIGMGGREIPDYLHDLNAMHEAERALGLHSLNNRAWEYRMKLGGLVLLPPLDHAATAAQRAEAFLRTLGKWEDGK